MSESASGIVLIVALALATYASRLGGYLVLSRFERLNPRVEAALDAVPAAVLAAITAPMAFAAGWAEAIASAIVILAVPRLPILAVMAVGAVSVVVLRALGL